MLPAVDQLPAMATLSALFKRQCVDDFGDMVDCGPSWWYSTTGYAVRYTITAVIILLLLLYFVGGYMHAVRRLNKGLAPLAYHRWMVRRSATRLPYPHGQPYYAGGAPPPPGGYPMHSYGPQQQPWQAPPPVYNNEVPPAYVPPPGGSKINPDQHVHVNPFNPEGPSSPPPQQPGYYQGFGAGAVQQSGPIYQSR